jgi:pimeloyl-ACP methyl ester carboxylesterase
MRHCVVAELTFIRDRKYIIEEECRLKEPFPAGQTVTINEMQMYYVTFGQGQPLVLLHGYTGSSGDWELFLPDLAKEHRLIIPDLRGHGRSTNPSTTFTFRQAALDVFALLDHLGIEQFKAIGMSGGGNTLLHMATHQPGRVAAMALVSAVSYYPEQSRTFMRDYTVDKLSDEEWRIQRQRHQHGDEQIRALWRHGQAFKDDFHDMNFIPPYLSTITARTLIVYGDRDPLYPVSMALEMFNATPHSYLCIVPNAGHLPVSYDLREPFIKTVLPFLRGDWENR